MFAHSQFPRMPFNAQYKYVVDGVWRYDPWAPVVRDEDGNLNNVLEVVDPCTSFDIPVEFDAPPSPQSRYRPSDWVAL